MVSTRLSSSLLSLDYYPPRLSFLLKERKKESRAIAEATEPYNRVASLTSTREKGFNFNSHEKLRPRLLITRKV
jgi:hypothetical protein